MIKSLIRKSLHAVQKDRRTVFDMAVSAALQFFSMAIGLATTAILTRTLSSGDIGFCALIMSIVGIGGALTDFGIGKLAVRYAAVAHHENDKNGLKAIFRWIFRLRFSLAVVAFSALYFCASYLCSVVWHEPMSCRFCGLVCSIPFL